MTEPGEAGRERGRLGEAGVSGMRDDELEKRGRELDTALAARRSQRTGETGGQSRGGAGYAQALRLSSEFIAGIVVGAGLGWFIDRLAGTSPWGLILLLLLGFAAGVLNVLRSAGHVADFGRSAQGKDGGARD